MMQNTNQENSPEKTSQISRWHHFETQDAINQATLNRILAAADEAIDSRGCFSIVLAGGSTPKSVYALLKDANADWANWHVYHNDDRCLPLDNSERNSLMARTTWLNHVSIPANQIHDIPAELGNIEGAKTYAKTLVGVPEFDLVLLGLGEDGHTASLFPNQPLDNSADAVPVFDAPKPPADRITLSQLRLSNTREVIFLVTGAGKQDAVNDWRNSVAIPATLISPKNGVDVYCFGVTF
jgi:6-phosphogluconolactonase